MAIGDLTPSYEDYIEAIYDLALHGDGSVRSTDVADALGFSKASVARATKNLREMGYIEQERYGEITLTPAGKEYGEHLCSPNRLKQKITALLLPIWEWAARKQSIRRMWLLSGC